MEKKPISHLLVGVIIALVSCVAFLAFYFTGKTFDKSAINYLPTLLTLGLLIFFIVKYSNDLDNNVTFGKCFSYGFKATAVMTLIVFVFSLVFILMTPAFKEEFSAKMAEEFAKNPEVSEEQQEQLVAGMNKFFMISILGGGVFMNLLVGAVASLIGAAVAKKNPNVTPFNQ